MRNYGKKSYILGVLTIIIGIYFLWTFDYSGPLGQVQKKLLINKDAIAEILPPPLYIVESVLIMNHFAQVNGSNERAQLLKLIKEKHDKFNTHKAKWVNSFFYLDKTNRQLFDNVFSTGEQTYEIFYELAKSFNSGSIVDHNIQNELSQKINLSFESHRQSIEQLVKALDSQQKSLELQSQAKLKQYRFLIVILLALLAFVIFMSGSSKADFSYFNIEQLWLPLLVIVLSYWLYEMIGLRGREPGPNESSGINQFLDLIFVGFVTFLAARIMKSRHLEMTKKILKSEQRYRELLQSYSTDIVARIEHERKRISREIHDGIIQLLGSVKFRLESFKRDSNQSDVSQMADLERSLELLQTTITDLRRLCFEMRPSLIDQVGLMTAMNSLIEDFEKGTNIVVIADFDFEDQILNEAQSLALFRIFQELLRNSERHSDATEITMDIFKKDSFIHMEVGDNGKGEIIQNNGLPWRIGMGLINIQERVRTIDGSVEFSSSKGEGFQVKVKIPIAMDQTGVEYGTSSLSTGR